MMLRCGGEMEQFMGCDIVNSETPVNCSVCVICQSHVSLELQASIIRVNFASKLMSKGIKGWVSWHSNKITS